MTQVRLLQEDTALLGKPVRVFWMGVVCYTDKKAGGATLERLGPL
jgi:hypothetical protein